MVGKCRHSKVIIAVFLSFILLVLPLPARVAVGEISGKVAGVASPRIRHILRPTLGCPSFVTPGEHLEVDFSLQQQGCPEVQG